jgi:hypothetical protein
MADANTIKKIFGGSDSGPAVVGDLPAEEMGDGIAIVWDAAENKVMVNNKDIKDLVDPDVRGGTVIASYGENRTPIQPGTRVLFEEDEGVTTTVKGMKLQIISSDKVVQVL